MKHKTSIEQRIRGWLPKEPKMPSQDNPIQKQPQQKPTPIQKLSQLWSLILVSLVSMVINLTILIGLSTIQIALITAISILGIALLLLWISHHKKITKYLKICLILVVVFALSFNGLGYYLFQSSGYPPTYVPQLTYSNMHDASLEEYLQNVEDSQGFRFLQTEHLGTVTFFALNLWPSEVPNSSRHQAWFMWRFYAKDTNNYITIGLEAGKPYSIGSDDPFQFQPPSSNFTSPKIVKESFKQIDALGLNWFNDRAIEIYQKQTGMNEKMRSLEINIFFDNQDNYQGIVIHLAFTVGNINLENGRRPTVYAAEFQPNGTLISFIEE
jgi:hypothetical protein